MKLIDTVHNADVKLFNSLIHSPSYKTLGPLAFYVSKTGDGHLYVLLGLGLFVVQGADSLFLKALFLAFLIERPIYFVLKNSFKRNRPQQALRGYKSLVVPSDLFSFPSGHSSAAFMVATIVAWFLPVLFLPLLLWAMLVALSRVILGVHFPTDTLMGMLLGAGVAMSVLAGVIA